MTTATWWQCRPAEAGRRRAGSPGGRRTPRRGGATVAGSTSPEPCCAVRCSRRGRYGAGRRRGRDADVEVGGAVAAGPEEELRRRPGAASWASSCWYSASSAMSGARNWSTLDPNTFSSRGPSFAASATSRVSAFARRSSPRSFGSASRVRRSRGSGQGSPLQRRTQPRPGSTGCRARPPAPRQRRAVSIPVASASQDAVDRSPVSTAMSSAPARTATARPRREHGPGRRGALRVFAGLAELRSDRRDLVQGPLDRPRGDRLGGGHQTSPPSTTDTRSRPEPRFHKGFRRRPSQAWVGLSRQDFAPPQPTER